MEEEKALSPEDAILWKKRERRRRRKRKRRSFRRKAFGVLAPTCFFFNPGICFLLNPPMNKAQKKPTTTTKTTCSALIGFSIRQQSTQKKRSGNAVLCKMRLACSADNA